MELDNLIKNLKKKTQSSPSPTYLAIEIGPETVKAATWHVVAGKPQVIDTGSIEEADPKKEKDLLEAIDQTVSSAQEGITPEPQAAIFSLPESWVKGEEITKTKKEILQSITKKLGLKPMGFVTTTDAVIHYLKDKQGGPISSILLGLTQSDVIVTLVTSGKQVDSHTVGRSDDLGADVEEGIARIGDVDTLPAHMVLYDGHTDLDNQKQVLLSYDWQERLPFLHIPKIDTLDPDETVRAAAIAGGYEVLQSGAIPAVEESTPARSAAPAPSPQEIPDMSSEFGFSSTAGPADGERSQTSLSTKQDPSTESDSAAKPSGSASPDHPDSQAIAAELKVNDITATDTNLLSDEHDNLQPIGDFGASAEDSDEPASPTVSGRAGGLKGLLSNFKNPLSRFSPPRRSQTTWPAMPAMIIAGIVILILLFAGAGLAYWRLPTATVTIFLEPRVVDTRVNLTLDPGTTEPNIDEQIIPAQPFDVEVKGTKSAAVTGEKLVGDRATGTVTIYNRTDSVKTFEAGTRLTGPDSLVYTIDDDVTIASASTKENPDLSITKQPSTADVGVTAGNIGAEYNQGSGIEFSVANFGSSSFVARSSGEITGGTSRQITAVSEQDLVSLSNALREELEQQIATKTDQTSEGNAIGAVIVPGSDEEYATDFSAELGDEATSLTLEGTLTVKTLTYKKSDLSLIIEKDVKSVASDNYDILRSESEIDIIDSELNDDDSVTLTATAKAKIVPILSEQEIIANIKGRYPGVLNDYFQSIQGFSRVEIDLNPELPARLGTLPRIADNIKLDIETIE